MLYTFIKDKILIIKLQQKIKKILQLSEKNN